MGRAYGRPIHQRGFITAFDGTTWNIRVEVNGSLNGVLAFSRNDIWVIGALRDHGGGNLLHGNGTTWRQSRLAS